MDLLLIAIFLIIFAIISYKKLEWGVYLIALLLPSYLIRFSLGPIPFTFLVGMIAILVIIWLYKEIKNNTFFKTLKNTVKCKFFLPAVLFFIAATISVFISPSFMQAAGIWKAYFLEPIYYQL